MLRSLICLLVLVMGIMPAIAQAKWWQEDWQFRKPITINTTANGGAITGTVGRVPVLVRLHSGNFSFEDVAQDGADLRFVAADEQTVLNYQIETFDPLLGIATIWVDVPDIAGGATQTIWMYYGNQQAPATSNGQLTFDPNYTLVYHFSHMAQAPARDSTAYGNHAQTTTGSTVDALMGQGLQLTGQAPLMLPASPSLALPAGGSFTFSAWLRIEQSTGQQAIYVRRDNGNSLLIGLADGVPFVEVNGQRSSLAQPLTPSAWQYLTVTSNGQQLTLYVNGHESSVLTVSLPPLDTPAAIGADILPQGAAAEATPTDAEPADVPALAPFTGAMDEVRLSKIARSASLILADATAQGRDSLLVQYGADEQQSGFNLGGLGFLLGAVPLDAWVVIAVLIFMMVQSWHIMITKHRRASQLDAANTRFRHAFAKVGTRLDTLADNDEIANQLKGASLWRLYEVAINEIRLRRRQHGTETAIGSATTIEAIRAAMEVERAKESRDLGSRLGTLSNAVAGGPYIGLLGTVLGIMMVFLGTAMAGDVNINAIAPGMAAALLATAMGLFVAIPALFGYNRLVAKNKEINTDMRVFVDEFVTRLAELNNGYPPTPHAVTAQSAQAASA